MGAAFAVIVPAALIASIFTLKRARWRRGSLLFAWGALYLALWWIGTPHEPRHLLPLLVLWGVPALQLVEPGPDMHRLTVAAASLFSLAMATRMLLFAHDELRAFRSDYSTTFALPESAIALIPDGATVQNQASRPYNFALLGPRLSWNLHDYAPSWPTAADLRFNRIDYLFYRGRRSDLHAAADWKLLYYDDRPHAVWWEAVAGDDVIALYAVGERRDSL
jgi:hypothetical protein